MKPPRPLGSMHGFSRKKFPLFARSKLKNTCNIAIKIIRDCDIFDRAIPVLSVDFGGEHLITERGRERERGVRDEKRCWGGVARMNIF